MKNANKNLEGKKNDCELKEVFNKMDKAIENRKKIGIFQIDEDQKNDNSSYFL